eukprot:CAMPEP_0118940832 /NCGR_PEP_ID=MMETSP1169-20130426/32454_1 /TAXON_ID=36882 /ORGANISM="Pyramimonas obovata, Strain CCMP722" /LENGTH=38 /DNA_ID= /DNA_START= /DNA_END= /DNA_ORIENTATION=
MAGDPEAREQWLRSVKEAAEPEHIPEEDTEETEDTEDT